MSGRIDPRLDYSRDHTTDLLRMLSDGAVSGRWTPRRKTAALELLKRGVLTVDQLDERYGVQAHEVEEWKARAGRFGVMGLAVTLLQEVGR